MFVILYDGQNYRLQRKKYVKGKKTKTMTNYFTKKSLILLHKSFSGPQ